MLDKLKEIEKKYDEINQKLFDPNVASDVKKLTALSKEAKQLEPVVLKYREYESLLRQVSEAKEELSDRSIDAELKELLELEIDENALKADEVLEQIKVLLIPKDPNDEKNVIVEIRAGTGGEEGALFAGTLFRMYSMYAERKGFKIEIINQNETELGGFKEISFEVIGEGAYSRFKFESGVHRVQRVPETESSGRIHTSAATVAVLPEADEVDVDIKDSDLKIDVYHSSGAGGQKVNKTATAIRITHLPTGTVVECQDERSQLKNKNKAMKVLRSRILESEMQKQAQSVADSRRSMVKSGDRSEKIRTYNFPQSRVSDHRIGLTIYKLEQFLNGDMDEVIDALITYDTAEKLKSGAE